MFLGAALCVAWGAEAISIGGSASSHPRLWAPLEERSVYGLTRDRAVTGAALAADARLLAVGYQTAAARGWLVFDLTI